MAVQEKQLNAAKQEITVDLSFMSKSKLKTALTKLSNLLRLGALTGNDDSTKFDVEKAREAQMANFNNIANTAQFYSRRF